MLTETRQLQKSSVPTWLVKLGWEDRYQVLDLIGFGGMGQVWRACDVATGQMVALKVIDPSRVGEEHLLARLEAEADALLSLRAFGQHEHIVPILDFKLTDTHACLVMAFIPGLDMCSWCDMHRLPISSRVALLAKAALAAGWCHQHGIVHRDLKPSNILVHSATGAPIVVDFSIAKTNDPLALTLTNEALGTAPYMAPEQWDRSQGEATPASDVYALGATLYELLTYVHPHPGDLAQIIRRHQNEDTPARLSLLNKEVPPDLECIVLKALSHRPSDRYADGTALASDLERFLKGQPVHARPLSTITHLVRQAQRRPAFAAVVFSCIVISVFALASVLRAAKERRWHELEARIANAMQGKSWSRAALQEVNDALAALAVDDAARTAALRDTVIEDVVNDVEANLKQPYLKADDITWMRDEAIAWLEKKNPPQSVRLQGLMTEHLSRWELIAKVHPPFTDMAGLFSRSKFTIQGDLLFPNYEDNPKIEPKHFSPANIVKERLTTPAEVSATFVANPSSFKHVAIGFELHNARTEVLLYSVRHAPKPVIAAFKDQEINPNGFILYSSKRKRLERFLYISDAQLLSRPFKMTVRIEHGHLDADVNGQWSLSMDDIFVVATAAAKNWCHISWPRNLGLRELSIRTRSTGVSNPLELGDLLFTQEKWPEAQRLYESMKGDPMFGLQASFKAGLAQWQQNKIDAALASWEPISSGPASPWRDLSSYHLWVHTAINQGISAGRPYLQRLPEANLLTPAFKNIVTDTDRKQITKIYQAVGLGLNALRNNAAEVREALKAMRIVEVPPVEIASKLSLAFHSCGLDDEATQLLHVGLDSRQSSFAQNTGNQAALIALDHWTRFAHSESNDALKVRLDDWCNIPRGDSAILAVGGLENARVQARSGDYKGAQKSVRLARARVGADPRQITSSWLLEGIILRLMGNEPKAQQAWQQGIQVSSNFILRSAVNLCDLVVLRSLAKAWDREAVVQIIDQLTSRSRTDPSSLLFQSEWSTTFFSSDDFVRSLNTMVDQQGIDELAKHTALRTKPAREILRAWYGAILKSYFLYSAFSSDVSNADEARVQSIVEQLMVAISASEENDHVFFTFMQKSGSPLLGQSPLIGWPPYPAPLVARLKWLLAQRYLHINHAANAKPLLEQIKDERSLDAEWRASIAKQLTH